MGSILFFISFVYGLREELFVLKKYLEVGKIVSTHGVRGELKAEAWADSPDFLKRFKVLYLDGKGEKSLNVVCRPHGNMVLIKAQGIDTVEQAQAMRGKVLFMDRNDAELGEGNYFVQDLIGCKAVDAQSGRLYGEISDVSQTGANDVWHISNNGKEYLIPAIKSVVNSTDVENGVVTITPMKGIFDDED